MDYQNPYGYSPAYAPYQPQQYPQPVRAPQMYQQQQQPAQQPQAPQGLSAQSRAVTSREEAMGVAADFSGALMIMPDIAHNRVYVKRWNLQTGTAEFAEYIPAVEAPPPPPPPTYVTQEAFEERIAKIEETLSGMAAKKPKKESAE